MSAFGLPNDFALQSLDALRIVQSVRQGSGLAFLIEARGYPAKGAVRISGLTPLRHYRLSGAVDGFCRASGHGCICIHVSLRQSSLLMMSSVI